MLFAHQRSCQYSNLSHYSSNKFWCVKLIFFFLYTEISHKTQTTIKWRVVKLQNSEIIKNVQTFCGCLLFHYYSGRLILVKHNMNNTHNFIITQANKGKKKNLLQNLSYSTCIFMCWILKWHSFMYHVPFFNNLIILYINIFRIFAFCSFQYIHHIRWSVIIKVFSCIEENEQPRFCELSRQLLLHLQRVYV